MFAKFKSRKNCLTCSIFERLSYEQISSNKLINVSEACNPIQTILLEWIKGGMPKERKGYGSISSKLCDMCLIINAHLAVTDNFCRKYTLHTTIIVRLAQEHLAVFQWFFGASSWPQKYQLLWYQLLINLIPPRLIDCPTKILVNIAPNDSSFFFNMLRGLWWKWNHV